MSRYLHGIHDPGGEHLHGDKPGWTVVTEEIGLNLYAPGRDYTPISNRGIGVIVRLNHAYGSGGTIPMPDKYPQFAAACASWAARSQGVEWYIVGNEPNGEWERPNGVIITPEEYARCFLLCSEAIKRAMPGARVMHAAIGPYHASPTPWHHYLREVLRIIAPSGLCDGLNFHAYARSMNPGELLSEIRMDAPLQGKYYGFLTILDAIDEVPRAMLSLPAFITEFDVYGGWENRNTGIITAMYDWVHGWNIDRDNFPKFQAAVNFRWLGPPDVDNVHDWEIRNKPQLQDDFRAAVGRGYLSPQGQGSVVPPQQTTSLPFISTGSPAEPTPDLPPREIDPRAADRGTTIQSPIVPPGRRFWRVKRLYTPDEAESNQLGPNRHVLANSLVNGIRQEGVRMLVTWGGGGPNERAIIHTKNNPNFAFSADHALTPGDFTLEVDDGHLTERVVGIKMGMQTPRGWNPGAHTSTLVDFELATMPQTIQPAPQPTQPATVPALAHPVADPRWRNVTQVFGVNGDYYRQFRVDGVALRGHNGIDFGTPTGTSIVAVDEGVVVEQAYDRDGYGEYVKVRHAWGESLYAHLNITYVGKGSPVQRGLEIAKSGNSGNSTGPHLHFAMRVAPFDRRDGWGGYSDPAPYLINVTTPTTPEPTPTPSGDVLALIKDAAEEFSLDWRFVASLAWYESNWIPTATSPVGAMGIMQMMPPTWAEWSAKVGAKNPYDEQDNIRTGAAYLAWLLKQVGGNEWNAVVAYNFGIGNFLKGVQPPPETVAHASSVIKTLELLEAIG